MNIRSLYDCLHAQYPVPPNEYITCSKGHKLGQGHIHKRQVDREDKLVFKICALCKDFSDINDLTTNKNNDEMEE